MARRTQPRLKVNDNEVGLRDLGNGLFEPKNLSVFNDVIAGQFETNSTPKKFWLENQPPKHEPKQYHKIESFCFVVTEWSFFAKMTKQTTFVFLMCHDNMIYLYIATYIYIYIYIYILVYLGSVQEQIRTPQVFCK